MGGEKTARRGVVKLALEDLNHRSAAVRSLREREKDQQKSRQEAGVQPGSSSFACNEPRCSFVSLTSAALTNHRHQKHGAAAAQVHKQ